jgi:hypothetical protein
MMKHSSRTTFFFTTRRPIADDKDVLLGFAFKFISRMYLSGNGETVRTIWDFFDNNMMGVLNKLHGAESFRGRS